MSTVRKKYDEIIVKTLLATSTVWMLCESVALGSDATDPLMIGARVEKLGIVGILGAIIAILVIALVIVYRGKESQAEEKNTQLRLLVERVCTAVEHNAIVIDKCRKG